MSPGDRHASINHLRFNSLVSSARNVTTYTVYTQFNRPTNVLSSVKLSDTQDTNQVRLSIGSPDWGSRPRAMEIISSSYLTLSFLTGRADILPRSADIYAFCHRGRRRSVVHITGVVVHFRCTIRTNKSLLSGLEPPMHRPGSNWSHRCILCNNSSLPNFIQIGQHLEEKRPKNCFFSTSNTGRPLHGEWLWLRHTANTALCMFYREQQHFRLFTCMACMYAFLY